ncbi:MAG TPA: YifB family Mg chelatase-like AAA ATPase [Solirubrobacteraceae bacterium]|jgi:magnesium chelatase family protein|nr:YifB family Mg chelatase-like AAA ATPase [Solirubrobacteraceae bacterium]
MVAQAHTFTLDGPHARHVVVELDVRSGLPAFAIVGLADAAVREARERIQTAIRNSGFDLPTRRITANLAPGDLRKAGPGLDLALACALLAATGQVPPESLARIAMFGELGLDGSVRPAHGTLAVADAARRSGLTALGVAAPAGHAAALVEGLEVAPLRTLRSAARVLRGGQPDPLPPRFEGPRAGAGAAGEPELSDVRGASEAVRALVIAAAGGHSLLLSGAPGVGKTMLVRRLPGILPRLDTEEAIELARTRGETGRSLDFRRPFRAPHHTTSAAGLLGRAANGAPGEVALAHRGVLFLDELTEFSRGALDALRQPLEEGCVTIARAGRSVVQPARFMLVGAANPCPCGAVPGSRACRCSRRQIERHARRLSASFLDRIDVRVAIRAPDGARGPAAITSARARGLIAAARERQRARLAAAGLALNGEMDASALARHVRLDAPCRRMLATAAGKGLLSPRGEHGTIKLARTIADLDGRGRVRADDVAQALALRCGLAKPAA